MKVIKLFSLTLVFASVLVANLVKPSDLVLKALSSSEVLIKWRDNSDSETGYKIYRDDHLIDITSQNVTSYKDTNLLPNHTYRYTIKATDDKIILSSNKPLVDQIVDRGKYKYYKFYAHKGDSVNVDLYNQDANGNLYVKIGSPASIDDFDCKSENGGKTHNTDNESCSVKLDKDSYVYIAVHAPSYGSYNNVKHTIKASVDNGLAYEYGKMGDKIPVLTRIVTHLHDANDDKTGVIYHPSDWDINPTPVVFFARGWTNIYKKKYGSYKDYDTFLKFIASKGYSVIYFEYNENFELVKQTINKIVEENKAKFDTSRIGVIGHSSGGGNAFRVLKDMIELGYGKSDKFLMSVDPYYAGGMKKANMQNISDTNIVIVQIGFDGKDRGNDTDPRIVLTMYDLLNDSNDKNYIVIPSDNNEPAHDYINKKSVDQMQLLLKPLDALMRYTFDEKDPKHHAVALEGKDKIDPYNGSQKVLDSSKYEYNCQRATDETKKYYGSDINYCGDPLIQPN